MSWQQALKDRNRNLELENWKLKLQLEEQAKRLAMSERVFNSPPTVMIACEKIVEAAAQLTCSANTMMKGVYDNAVSKRRNSEY